MLKYVFNIKITDSYEDSQKISNTKIIVKANCHKEAIDKAHIEIAELNKVSSNGGDSKVENRCYTLNGINSIEEIPNWKTYLGDFIAQ